METKKKHELSLAKRMAISLVCGLVAGLAFMFLREHLNASGQAQTWTTINNLLFQDITAEGAERAFGIFYIIGQLFIKALQLVIIPMVFTSISLAIGSIADTRTMGRISAKTLFWFLLCSFLALLLAGCVGYGTYSMGLFNTRIEGLAEASGSTGSNPLNVVLNIIPSNIITAFGSNGAVLSSVFLAVAIGLSMNTLGESRTATLRRLLGEADPHLRHLRHRLPQARAGLCGGHGGPAAGLSDHCLPAGHCAGCQAGPFYLHPQDRQRGSVWLLHLLQRRHPAPEHQGVRGRVRRG